MKLIDVLTIVTIATIGSLNIYNHSYAATSTRLVRLSLIPRVAIAAEPQTSEDYVERGQAKSDAKDYQGAIIEYTRAIELNPESAAAYRGRSDANYELLKKKNPGSLAMDTESLNDIRKYTQLESDSGLYLKNSTKKFKDKDYSGAISDLDRVIKISYAPHVDRAYILRGIVKFQGLGRKEDALRDVEYGAERLRKRGNTELYNKALEVMKKIKESS
jgi:tetratricopeptide (TPR) repeat protein